MFRLRHYYVNPLKTQPSVTKGTENRGVSLGILKDVGSNKKTQTKHKFETQTLNSTKRIPS